jgi:hypothetical protein
MKRPTDDFWNALNELDQKLGSISYYELLGVDAAVDLEAIRTAYERQVRVVHPDRHAREGSAERKQCLTRVYARIGEAFRILSHTEKRADYDRKLDRGMMRYKRGRTENGPRVQLDPQHPHARSLFEQAQSMIEQGDKKAARAKLMLARQYQSDSKAIAAAMAECDEQPDPSPAPAPVQTETREAAPDPAPAATDLVLELAGASTPTTDPEPQTRAHVRVPMEASIQVRCEAWKDASSLKMLNISRGGILVQCEKVLPIASVLELTLESLSGKPIELPAEVVRHTARLSGGEAPGMGLRFLLIPEPVREDFEALLDSAGIQQRENEAQAEAPAPAPPATEAPETENESLNLIEDEPLQTENEEDEDENSLDLPDLGLDDDDDEPFEVTEADEETAETDADEEPFEVTEADEEPAEETEADEEPAEETEADEIAEVIAKGQQLIDAGTPGEAIPLLQIAVRNDPEHKALRATFHLAAGLTARQKGLSEPAHMHFERALRYDPDSPLVLRHLRDDTE